ncbi:MAG: hypothetical protein HYT98_03595 [Candidatus Sungbacteria bacterium]|nr:hypothetical protein [Candidatus Sungbacteria bacterium]
MRYKDINHFKSECGYEVNGAWLPRVTKILDIKAKPGLDIFFKEVGDYSSAEDIKNKSAEEGTKLHRAIQGLFTGNTDPIPGEVRPAVDAFQEFNEARKIELHPEFVERLIWSGRYKYAGTVDALAVVDGKFGVLDIKTSTGFWPEYNLQTAAYISALQEFEIKKTLALPQDVQTRWILRIDQNKICKRCKAVLREKGGRAKVRNGKSGGVAPCPADLHEWGELRGEVEIREFPYFYNDTRAFIAAKILWEWENGYWLRQIGYLK